MHDFLPASFTAWMTPRRLLRASVLVALLTIVLKTLAWWLTGSVGLLSDALEAFVNLAGAMFALAMVTVAERPADVEHPYGHHKAEYFSSGFEGILIVGASAAIVWASVQRLLQPQPLEQLGWGMALSLLSTGLNGVLAWAMFRTARQHQQAGANGADHRARHFHARLAHPLQHTDHAVFSWASDCSNAVARPWGSSSMVACRPGTVSINSDSSAWRAWAARPSVHSAGACMCSCT